MRVIIVKAPAGLGAHVVELAFASGLKEVASQQVQVHRSDGKTLVGDVVELEAPTPRAKELVEKLLSSPLFDPGTFSVVIREARAIIRNEAPGRETEPTPVPPVEAYEELWKFSHVTPSLFGRVLMASVLVAHGMIGRHLPIMLAGLLFLPYHHTLSAMAFALAAREKVLLVRGALAWAVTTALIVLGGAVVAAVTRPPIQFQELGSSLSGFVLSAVIGVAAGLASSDDAGRRELIGLAATAHITVLPAWFGISLVFGSSHRDELLRRSGQFAISVASFTIAATLTFAALRMRQGGLPSGVDVARGSGAPGPEGPGRLWGPACGFAAPKK